MHSSRLLQTLLTVLPVLTAGTYSLGLAYHQGYLAAFGIDDSIFALAADKALYTGFISLTGMTFATAPYAVFSATALVLLIMVAAVLSSTDRANQIGERIKARVQKLRFEKVPSQSANELVDKSATLYAYVTGIILAPMLLLLIFLFSDKSGREQAEKEMASFIAGKAVTAQLFSPEVSAPFVGKLVMCGEKYCAFWTNTGSVIVGHDAIKKIVTSLPAPAGKAASKP